MPQGEVVATPGLGTSIVEALARQLHARVKIADCGPGTAVSVIHAHIAAVESGDAEPVGQAI
jgi:two-component sensor histidine kinase